MDIKDKILKIIKQLPPVSKSLFQIMKIIGEKNYSFQDIARAIEYDPILTAKILKITNSSSLGLKRKHDSVKSAIPYLGEKTIISLAIDSCAHGFYNAELEGYISEEGELWQHSIMTAIIGREIAPFSSGAKLDPNQVFTAGILHDIGKAVISSLLKEAASTKKTRPEEDMSLQHIELESARISTNHCEAGKILAQHWGLPELYQEVINYHHTPDLSAKETRSLVYAVHLSDIIAMEYGMGTGADSLQYKLDFGYTNYFDLDTDKINGIIIRADDEYNKINEYFKTQPA